MELKLFKTEEGYVAVNNEKFKHGDHVLINEIFIVKVEFAYGTLGYFSKEKVAFLYFRDEERKVNKVIATEFCFKLIGVPQFIFPSEEVQIMKLSEEVYREFPTNPKEYPEWKYGRDKNCFRKRKAFIKGYNEAKSKFSFSEDDLRKFSQAAFVVKSNNETIIEDFESWFTKRLEQFKTRKINSIEIEVYKLIEQGETDYFNYDDGKFLSGNVGQPKIIRTDYAPEGLLIVKKINY